jgi:protein-S-isoprenylcysteine O-methyltransferase Ste14
MKRWAFFTYGVCCHLGFVLLFAYMAGFVGNFLVPRTVDAPAAQSVGAALVIDFALLALFAMQHSVMARPAFKRVWTRVVPQPIERSTYVLIAGLVTALLMWQWRGIDITIWDIQQPVVRGIVWALFGAGFLLVFLTSLMIDHFDLFGTRQVWLYFRGRPYTSLVFRTPLLYGRVRHPLYLGWMLAFWAIPTMTLSHLVFAATMTLYMAGAALIEERDLVGHFGEAYRNYQRRVPMFMPRWRKSENTPAAIPATVVEGVSKALVQ